MKLLHIALKNITINWWRTITLGTFLFVISFILVFFSSFVVTMRNNMQDTIINSLVGHIQIRPGNSSEGDMAGIRMFSWDDVKLIENDLVQTIISSLHGCDEIERITPRVRHSVLGISDTSKEMLMIIGLDPATPQVKNNIILTEGRYLNPENENEIVLTQDTAQELAVIPGDTLGIIAKTWDGYTIDEAVTVVGIGQIKLLNMFGVDIGYVDLACAQRMMGLQHNQLTDIIIFTKHKAKAYPVMHDITAALSHNSIHITHEENQETNRPSTVRISTWNEMGGFFTGIVDAIVILFFVFLIFVILIVAILIANIVMLMGLERFKEIGTMRAIGFSKLQVIYLFIMEVILLTVAFGGAGIICSTLVILFLSYNGIPIGMPSMQYLLGDVFYIQYSVELLIPIILILLVFSAGASFFPARKAAGFMPVQSLREE